MGCENFLCIMIYCGGFVLGIGIGIGICWGGSGIGWWIIEIFGGLCIGIGIGVLMGLFIMMMWLLLWGGFLNRGGIGVFLKGLFELFLVLRGVKFFLFVFLNSIGDDRYLWIGLLEKWCLVGKNLCIVGEKKWEEWRICCFGLVVNGLVKKLFSCMFLLRNLLGLLVNMILFEICCCFIFIEVLFCGFFVFKVMFFFFGSYLFDDFIFLVCVFLFLICILFWDFFKILFLFWWVILKFRCEGNDGGLWYVIFFFLWYI